MKVSKDVAYVSWWVNFFWFLKSLTFKKIVRDTDRSIFKIVGPHLM